MSGTVVFEDAKLKAVELIAETVTLNNFSVSTTTSFQQTTNVSNATTNTVRFTNPTTAFVTTGNVHVGTAGKIIVSNASQATSSTTGAVQIAGGVGVAGDVVAAKFIGDGSSLTGLPWTESDSNIYYEANVAIGTSTVTSGARLEVDGKLQLSNGASTNVTMSATSANVPDWTVASTWASYATGNTWVASGHANSDAYHYGESLDISEDGTYAVIGANQGGTGDGTTQAGEVYVYIRTGTTWTQQAKLEASDKAIGDYFGSSVAINKDGTYLAVGASGDDNSNNSGSLYVFTRSGTTWSQQQKLIPSDLGNNEWLSGGGDLVAIDHTGERIVVSSYVHPYGSGWGTGNYGKGAAWVFKRTGTTWSQEAKLTASDGSPLDYFADSIDMSGDGATIVGGARTDDTGGTTNHGSAYVFTRSGTTWTQTAKINADTTIAGETFGHGVSIGGADWTTIAVGASCAAQAAPRDVGSVYIFTRPNASSTSWSQQQKLQASDALADGHFGYSVDLSYDGNSLMVGAMAPAGHSTAMDKAYVFTRTGTTWSEKTKFDESDVTNMSGYGNIVRISGDGKHVMVGAWQHQSYRGKAWIYTVGATTVPSLNVGGAAIVTSRDVTASAFLTSSDIRLKENIQEYSPENLLDKLRDVQVITYTNKPLNVPVAHTETQIGLSAQNILTLFPEYVDDSDTYYKMNYSKWPVLNTAAIKELTTQLQAEKAKVADLLARVTALENA